MMAAQSLIYHAYCSLRFHATSRLRFIESIGDPDSMIIELSGEKMTGRKDMAENKILMARVLSLRKMEDCPNCLSSTNNHITAFGQI